MQEPEGEGRAAENPADAIVKRNREADHHDEESPHESFATKCLSPLRLESGGGHARTKRGKQARDARDEVAEALSLLRGEFSFLSSDQPQNANCSAYSKNCKP